MHWTFGPTRPSRRSRLWAALFTPSLLFFSAPVAQAAPPAPTVVLVHGAWADGSTWREVIVRLRARGLHVVAVQNQLNSLADDAAAVARALEPITAPVVLVGHSWGGTVITQAGVSNKVAALVYVAAFAPDVGESTNDLQANAPPPGYVPLLQLDSAGYLWFSAGADAAVVRAGPAGARRRAHRRRPEPDPRHGLRRQGRRGRVAQQAELVSADHAGTA